MGLSAPRSSALASPRFGLLPKALLTLSLLVLALSLALSTTFLRVTSRRLKADLEARGNFLARSLAKTGRYGVFTNFPEILAPIAASAFEAGEVVFVEIVDREGLPLVTRADEGFPPASVKPLSRDDVRKLSTVTPRIDRLASEAVPRYEFLFPVILETAEEGEDIVLEHAPNADRPVTFERIGAVRVALSLSSLRQDLARVRDQIVAVTLVVAAVTFALTGASLRRIIGPITGLADAAHRVSNGDFSRRTQAQGRDEIGMLARAFNDMSERVESFQQSLERQVAERTEALASKTRDMEEFVYTVSHDLKAPVVSTHGLASLLAEEFGRDLPPDARVYVDRIKANAAHMERLIKDLFEMSRLDRSGHARESVPTGEVIQDVLLEHDAEIRSAGIAVRVAPDIPNAWAERDQITQLFENLIANAIKFRKPGEAGHVAIGGRTEGERTLLWVKDDGIGISADHHAKIFGLFQRLHTEREYPGTGLGLAIVKKIVERHGGSVQVRSELGLGAEFLIALPSHDGAPRAAADGSRRAGRGEDMLGRERA